MFYDVVRCSGADVYSDSAVVGRQVIPITIMHGEQKVNLIFLCLDAK